MVFRLTIGRFRDRRDGRNHRSQRRAVPDVPAALVAQWDAETPESTHREIDGTMVFVDISGFTAMSERLARFGKVGAEEVTEVLGECFSGLLAAAYPLGGRLIKFGGDALLLFFDGPSPAAAPSTRRSGCRT